MSFTVSCKDQDEVDYYWDRLTDGGEESQCGWCKDRFGLSWQIVPERLYELVSDPDPARATAATKAMYGMRKIVIADLERAAARLRRSHSENPLPQDGLTTCRPRSVRLGSARVRLVGADAPNREWTWRTMLRG